MKLILEKKVLFYGAIVRTFWMTLVDNGSVAFSLFFSIFFWYLRFQSKSVDFHKRYKPHEQQNIIDSGLRSRETSNSEFIRQ